MSTHLFVGGSRHGKPSQGYDTPTMRLHVEGQGLPPYLLERYYRTDVRVPLGDPTGPTVVYALEGLDRILVWGQPDNHTAVIQHVVNELVAEHGDRYREHFRFVRTGEGRAWSQP